MIEGFAYVLDLVLELKAAEFGDVSLSYACGLASLSLLFCLVLSIEVGILGNFSLFSYSLLEADLST